MELSVARLSQEGLAKKQINMGKAVISAVGGERGLKKMRNKNFRGRREKNVVGDLG